MIRSEKKQIKANGQESLALGGMSKDTLTSTYE